MDEIKTVGDLGIPAYEPSVCCGAYCYGGIVKWEQVTEYLQFTRVADVWVKGEDAAKLVSSELALRAKNQLLYSALSRAQAYVNAYRPPWPGEVWKGDKRLIQTALLGEGE